MSQKTHRIAILSDTHGLLRPEIVEILKTCEVILHGGDINSRKTLNAMEEIAPVHVVRGNNDKEWADGMAEELEITLFGLHIYMIHNKKHRKADLSGMDLCIYGHSHKYDERKEDGVLFLNPGSCGPRRFRQPVTMAVLEVCEDTGQWQVEKIDLVREEKRMENSEKAAALMTADLKQTVEAILKEMKSGRKVAAIADRLGMEHKFVEDVCRIYVTHPGVDAQGIVDRIEVNALRK